MPNTRVMCDRNSYPVPCQVIEEITIWDRNINVLVESPTRLILSLCSLPDSGHMEDPVLKS